jgi:hypothetical protein
MQNPVPFILAFGVPCTVGFFSHGMPGAVAGLLLGLFIVFFLGGIVAGNGILGGLGGVILAFVCFVVVMTGMYLFERFKVDGGPIAGKKDGPGGEYFADKVMDVFNSWLSGGGVISLKVVIVVCAIGVVLGLIAYAVKPK